MSNSVMLKTISELCKSDSFSIPDFQRGYKWTSRQVEDLLNDLDEFINNNSEDKFYCLQPLVVVPDNTDNVNKRWSVIDGQQRLTTIFLILCFLKSDNVFSISYQTRDDSADYLDYFKNYGNYIIDIETKKEENTDYYHIYNTYKTVKNWFISKPQTNIECLKCKFRNTLLNQTKFIWYECNEDNVVGVFTRINIGKIGLTNAELIKALMLNSSNWQDKNSVESEQYHIAEEWNRMEITLQNDEFWYFLCNKSDNYSTRIELLFDVICESDRLKKGRNKGNSDTLIGNDKYRTFRYFYNFFKSKNATLKECWGEVRRLFQVMTEWHKDVECYHYLGFIIECKKEKVKEWYIKWCESNDKDKFKETLKENINGIIKDCNESKTNDLLDQQYEIRVDNKKEISKTVCRPILLLHNIQLVIKQNKKDEKDIFQENVFYRFPFYLLKINNWDVEHIDSNTTNNLSDNYARLLWLLQYEKETWLSDNLKRELNDLLVKIKTHLCDKNSAIAASGHDNDISNEEEDNITEEDDNDADSLQDAEETTSIEELESQIKHPVINENNAYEEDIRQKMKSFVFEKDGTNRFDDIVSKIENEYEKVQNNDKRLNRKEKNQIWNFTLLDSKTNRSYGNSIFPRKRRTIMARDMGKECMLKFENGEFVFEMVDTAKSAFIPPVTRNVFMKYYTPNAAEFSSWNKDDAEAYKNDIKNMLSDFLS